METQRQKSGMYILLVLLATVNAQAAPSQALQDIRQAASNFIRNQVQLPAEDELQVEVTQLDKRLRLSACPQALSVSLPPGFSLSSRTSVQVQCPQAAEPWKLFVPLRLKRKTSAWVAADSLPREHLLKPADLKQETRSVDLETVLPAKAELLGKRLKQPLRAGQVIRKHWLEVPIQARRGDRVSLVAGSGRVQVRMNGVLLKDGRLGELVSVRNLSSRKTVQGWLVAPGKVQVGGTPPAAVSFLNTERMP